MHGADLPWYYNSLILPAPAARILKGKFRARNAQGARAQAHPSLSPPAQPEVRHEEYTTTHREQTLICLGSPAACVLGAGRRSAPRTHPITGRFIGTSYFFFFLCCFFYAFTAGSCSHTVVCPSLLPQFLLSDGKMAGNSLLMFMGRFFSADISRYC